VKQRLVTKACAPEFEQGWPIEIPSLLSSLRPFYSVELTHLRNVFRLHFSQTPSLSLVWQVVFCDLARLCGVGWERAETDFITLQPVQTTVVVSTGTNRFWQHDSSCVDGVPDLLNIAPASDLLDQHRCQSLRSQLLVDAEEVDFRSFDEVFSHPKVDRDTGDEGDELLRCRDTNTDVPFFEPARRLERPVEEGCGVIKAEHCLTILDVMASKEVINLIHLQSLSELTYTRHSITSCSGSSPRYVVSCNTGTRQNSPYLVLIRKIHRNPLEAIE